MAGAVQGFDFVSYLPEVVWYLTGNGHDMWCRRPYGFLFTTSDKATEFAKASGTSLELTPIGVARGDFMGAETLAAVRGLGITRLFLDPDIDPATNDVHGKVLKLEGMPQA
jgi:hypothetical protein